MTQHEAREIIMKATQEASANYRKQHPVDLKQLLKNSEKLDTYLNAETDYINSVLLTTIPESIGKLAV